MKRIETRILFTLALVVALMVPAMAQQTSSDANQQPATSSPPSAQSSSSQTAATPDTNSDQNMSALQPLQPDYRQGFWGKLNPFARKKYVQRQLNPIRNRVNELDDLTAANGKQIKDVDARAQEGIRQASAKASEADQHAIDAGNRAQQANQTAQQANTRLNNVEQVVGSIDQYQPTTETEIRFRPGQTKLSAKAQSALDDMAANLSGQRGYIIEVQGYSPARGQAGIQASQAMADSVVRYLVEKRDVPVYRIFVVGMGDAQSASTQATAAESSSTGSPSAKPYRGNRVNVSLLKNNVDQLASANPPSNMNNMNSAPANNSPATQPRQ